LGLRFATEKELNRFIAGQQLPKRSKYGNRPAMYDGRRFDSGHELARYKVLERQKAAKIIRGFAHQVTIPLPSGRRFMRLDFMIVENNGRITFEDAKGHITKDWAVKRDELEHHLGIRINTV
jgi:hypothetical protein